MAKIIVNRRSKTYRIIARGTVGLARDYYYLTNNVVTGADSPTGMTFQATLVQDPRLVRWEALQAENSTVTEEELQLLGQYDWDQAPDWANYAAVNADGSANWFAEMPVIDEARGRWVMRYADRRSWPMYSTVRMFRSWRDSLWERPVTVTTPPPSNGDTAPAPASLEATVVIEVSNDAQGWLELGRISLTQTDLTDGFSSSATWAYVRARLVSIGGENAFVTVTMGV